MLCALFSGLNYLLRLFQHFHSFLIRKNDKKCLFFKNIKRGLPAFRCLTAYTKNWLIPKHWSTHGENIHIQFSVYFEYQRYRIFSKSINFCLYQGGFNMRSLDPEADDKPMNHHASLIFPYCLFSAIVVKKHLKYLLSNLKKYKFKQPQQSK